MALILDTTGLSPRNTETAMSEFLDTQALPMRFSLDRPPAEMHSSASAWALGPLRTLQYEGSRLAGIRGPREVAATADPFVAIVSLNRGRTVIQRPGRTEIVSSSSLLILDLSEPFTEIWDDGASSWATVIHADDVGLPESTIRAASRGIAPSPLQTLVLRHLQHVHRAINDLSTASPAGTQALGDLSLDLVRALIASTDRRDPNNRDLLEDTLGERIEQYVLQNVRDPTLTIERIAREHFISIRKLHYLWADREDSLAEFIIQRRLDAALDELLSSGSAHLPLKVVALRSGFADPAHFSRRFKMRFGLPPGEYRNSTLRTRTTP